MSLSREVQVIAREYRKQGWRVTHTRRHLRFSPPGGGPFVIVACTPSDHRALKNIRARLKRADTSACDTLYCKRT